MDLGHNYIRDLSFLEYMPKMKYLVLAHTKIRDITPIAACKELVFLEINWTYVQDYSPLVELKKLEDLNLSRTYADVTPLLEMTWLKNLWIPNRPYDEEIVVAALPDTYVEIVSPNTKGWRHLENYYIMRDLLGMHYMSQ
jgi:Leucine-rich repeat (LRR) protein